jgi:predicted outer membrane repeat protein
MSLFLLYSKTAWKDYFSPATASETLSSQEYTSRPTLSGSNVYVLNCLFMSITSTTSGGAIYCSSSVLYLLVESTSFFSCKISGGNGGAIYFSNSNNGQCVLHEVCGYDCCTTDSNYVLFHYIYVKDDISSKNYVNYSSISRCVNENAYQFWQLYYGTIFCPSVNISNNKCKGNSVLCNPLSNSNSVTCSFSYSTISDNNATYCAWIILWTVAAKYEIKSCNILRNTQGSLNTRGTITTQGNLKITDSCILENIANYVFFQESSYTITLSNCTVDKTTNNGYLTTQSTTTKSFILALNHMSTKNCNTGYDSAGALTPIMQSSSSSKNQKNWCTGQNYRIMLRDEDIVSLIGILIFNFIHLDALSNPLYIK